MNSSPRTLAARVVDQLDETLSGWERLPAAPGTHWVSWRYGLTTVSAAHNGRTTGTVRVSRHHAGRDVAVAAWHRPDPADIGGLLASAGLPALQVELEVAA